MGNSFISFKKEGFWVNDAVIEIWLTYMVKAVEKVSDKPKWLVEAKQYWECLAKQGLMGSISPDLNNIITDEEKKKILISLSSTALEEIRNDGPIISKEKLNAFGVGGEGSYFTSDLEVGMFLIAGEKFIKLLQGELKADEDVF